MMNGFNWFIKNIVRQSLFSKHIYINIIHYTCVKLFTQYFIDVYPFYEKNYLFHKIR